MAQEKSFDKFKKYHGVWLGKYQQYNFKLDIHADTLVTFINDNGKYCNQLFYTNDSVFYNECYGRIILFLQDDGKFLKLRYYSNEENDIGVPTITFPLYKRTIKSGESKSKKTQGKKN
jgi:hypothetical protein